MSTEAISENERTSVRVYKKIMSTIEFMEKYLEDPDIFNPDSSKFKNFLIQSFCYLYPDFYYLSFLRKEDVDLEIIKVGRILQILPSNTKISKLFENMTKEDIHKFWLKFFTLFKKQNEFSTVSLLNISWENKINFFKGMSSTLNYLNYEFPVVNVNKLSGVSISEEINNWKEQLQCNSEMTSIDFDSCNIGEQEVVAVDTIQLSKDLNQVSLMYSNHKCINQQNTPEHAKFFINFINLVKNILEYKKNLSIINSATFLNKFNFKMFSNEEILYDNLLFIKRCNNFVKILKSKIKIIH